MINQTIAQGRMVYRSYYSIMIDQTITTKGSYYSIIIIIIFLFFYCVGSIAATLIVAAIDQLLAAISECRRYWSSINGDFRSRH
jgi:hypothetical protein